MWMRTHSWGCGVHVCACVTMYLYVCAMIGENGVTGKQHLISAGRARWGQVTDDGMRILDSG